MSKYLVKTERGYLKAIKRENERVLFTKNFSDARVFDLKIEAMLIRMFIISKFAIECKIYSFKEEKMKAYVVKKDGQFFVKEAFEYKGRNKVGQKAVWSDDQDDAHIFDNLFIPTMVTETYGGEVEEVKENE